MEQLAQARPWPLERLQQLPGQCVGSLMKNWAAHVSRRWGAHAEQEVRDCLGEEVSALLPSAPTGSMWLPLYIQIRTTDIIIERFLKGDALALEEMLWEDSQHNSTSASSKVLQWTGPGVLLRQAGQLHRRLYDVGTVTSHVGWGHAELSYQGTALFENPTWQLIQFFAYRLFLKATHRRLTYIQASTPRPESFQIQLKWKR